MHRSAGHSHCDSHHHTRGERDQRRLAWALVLVLVYVVAEFVGGWIANSLALLADAGHMLTDSAALGLSLFAIWIARRPANARQTYGYYRAEILAALVNAATLIAISAFIFIEACRRFGAPPEVQGGLMMTIAAGGLAVNIAGLAILSSGRADSLNIQGAWLHMLTDALGSVAAMAAGALVWWRGWYWVDPVASVLICLLVLRSSWQLLVEAVNILMEGTPRHIDLDEVRDALVSVPGACEVHDLHVWTITSGLDALSAHVVVRSDQDQPSVLTAIRDRLHERFGIDHITIQLEPVGFAERRAKF